MTVEAIDHINIRTPDVIGTSRFFADVLDMEITDTPGIPDRTKAAWIRDDAGRAVVHIGTAEIRYPWESEAEVNPEGSGRIHHVALRCVGHDRMIERLGERGIGYRANLVAEIGLRQLFISEPNGILLELNFFGD